MPETMEDMRVRLIDNGWFDRLFSIPDYDGCPRCGYATNSHGECICHDADRHGITVSQVLTFLGKPVTFEAERYDKATLSERLEGQWL